MKKYKQKELKKMVENGLAVDVTRIKSRNEINESYEKIGYSEGVNGLNGALFKGCESGNLYAVTSRATTLDMLF